MSEKKRLKPKRGVAYNCSRRRERPEIKARKAKSQKRENLESQQDKRKSGSRRRRLCKGKKGDGGDNLTSRKQRKVMNSKGTVV